MANKYGVPPVLLTGVIASELDFDYGRVENKIKDGFMRRLGVSFGAGFGDGVVHFDTLQAAAQYLKDHNLPGGDDAQAYVFTAQRRS